MRLARTAIALGIVLAAIPAVAADLPVAPGSNVQVTVYPGNLAFIYERRSFRLPMPEARLVLTGVSSKLVADSAALTIVPNGQVRPAEVRLVDQTFAFNAISPQSLLEHSLGQDVSLVTTNPATGRDIVERAKVVAVKDGVVLNIDGKIHTGAPGHLVFDGIPADLRSEPTLFVTADGPVNKDIAADLSYLTAGLDWHADYVAHYDGAGDHLDLAVWATVTNRTGTDFQNAKLKLAAGEVTPPPVRPIPMPMMAMAAAAPMPAPETPTAESVEGLHVYRIPRPTTLASGESKQLMLLQLTDLPVKHELLVRGQQSFFTTPMPGQIQQGSAQIEVVLKNEPPHEARGARGREHEAQQAGLGMPLPAGVVRAYGEASDGTVEYLGADQTEGAAPGADMRLRLGYDADVPVTREQVSFAHVADNIYISGWHLTFRNVTAKPVTVRVEEPIAGAWEVVHETLPHVKNDAGLPEWSVAIPAHGESELEYNIKTQI